MSLTQALSHCHVGPARQPGSGCRYVAANVANADTPGYIRKTVNQVQIVLRLRSAPASASPASIASSTNICSGRCASSSGASYADLRAAILRRLQIDLRRARLGTARSKPRSTISSPRCRRCRPARIRRRRGAACSMPRRSLTQQLNSMTGRHPGAARQTPRSGSPIRGQHRQRRDAADRSDSTRQLAQRRRQRCRHRGSLQDQRDQYIDQLVATDGHSASSDDDNNQVHGVHQFRRAAGRHRGRRRCRSIRRAR